MTLADLMRRDGLTETRTEGHRPDGHCRGCGSRPDHHIDSTVGTYCGACCHWITRSAST